MAGKSSKRLALSLFFLKKEQAINYAENRANFRSLAA
jgi:hypothetical protein